jgi:hypothetical protein
MKVPRLNHEKLKKGPKVRHLSLLIFVFSLFIYLHWSFSNSPLLNSTCHAIICSKEKQNYSNLLSNIGSNPQKGGQYSPKIILQL